MSAAGLAGTDWSAGKSTAEKAKESLCWKPLSIGEKLRRSAHLAQSRWPSGSTGHFLLRLGTESPVVYMLCYILQKSAKT